MSRHWHASNHGDSDRLPDNNWAIYSKVHHRLALLDSPDVDGWTPEQLATEYNCTVTWMRTVLDRLVRDGSALRTREGRYIGA